MPRTFDNINDHLGVALIKSLESAHRLDTSIGYFNLRGWSQLADAVDNLPPTEDGSPKVRVLIGMATSPDQELREALRNGSAGVEMDNKLAERLRKDAIANLRRQLTFGLPSNADEATLRRLKGQIQSGDVAVRLFVAHRLHAKLYLCHRADHDNPRTGFVGSSNLTFAGLKAQGELNVDVLDQDATEKLYKWFQDRWADQFAIDVDAELIELLEESWAGDLAVPPYHIYLKMAYHLSREAREGHLEYGLPEGIRGELLEYQAAAVQVGTRILNHRGGVLVGDVVGLGKTIVATAMALLMQEESGTETLIICPKNLVDMWEGYVHRYRVHAKVVPLSMVKDLETLRRYRVVIIDESHNLRSQNTQTYRAVKDYLDRNESKVILLTATPYNMRFADVANQIGLFYDPDAQLGIQPDRAMAKDKDFLAKCDGKPSTLLGFRRSEEPEDWRRLMSLFLVRRTRRFIRTHYAEQDEQGRDYLTFGDGSHFYFPDRVAHPLPHVTKPGEPAAQMVSDETLDAVATLKLPRYALRTYLVDGVDAQPGEQAIIEDLRKASGNLSGVTRTSLYKRLSSSGAAFVISLERHLLRNWIFKNALESDQPLPIGPMGGFDDLSSDDDEGPDRDELAGDDLLAADRTRDQWSSAAVTAYASLSSKQSKSIRWIRAEHFKEDLLADLEHDISVIQGLLAAFGDWDHLDDSKLTALEDLIAKKHPEEKVLVFTEYKDTAEYVENALRARGVAQIAHVSGSSDNPTDLARRFSPRSNESIGGLPDGEGELRVLISTDVLSEGQNLQDAHIVVNYDLPWAIIKIIQRAGRVDRVGQESPVVAVYSFMPSHDVEGVIGLRARIAKRLHESAVVFGSDESFFGDEGEREFLEGLYDEGRDLGDMDESDEDVDWASVAYAIWSDAIEADPALQGLIEAIPNSAYSTRARRGKEDEGAIVHVESEAGYDAIAFTNAEGESRLLTPYEALKLAECEPDESAVARLEDHHELVRNAVVGPLQTPHAHLEGALTGVRKRVWDRLTNFQAQHGGSLFNQPELTVALDALYRKPLTEGATHTLAKALRERIPEDVAATVMILHVDGRLCVADADLSESGVQLLCSMGVRKVD